MKRVLTALLLIPLVLGVNFFAPWFVVWAVLVLVALLCLSEFFSISEKTGFHPFRIVGYGAAAVWVFAPDLPVSAFLVGVTAILWVLSIARSQSPNTTLGDVATTLAGVVYVAGPFVLARELHLINPHWLFYVLVLNWAGDAAAYYLGKAFGRHKLAPTLSPNKTREGAIASVAAAAIVGAAYLHYFEPASLSILVAVLLSVVINIAAQLGDLAESALKRGAHLKDSGGMLPGHGGMLDRVDGQLFSFPACYIALLWLR
jgi:phosphatidate cytidylyltransferase